MTIEYAVMTTLNATSAHPFSERKGAADNLLPRERLFISFYLQSLNGADAARRAGYTGNMYAHGHRLLKDPRIKPIVEKGFAELAPTPREVIARISAQARATIADVFDIDDSGHPTLNLKKAEEAGKLGVIKSLKYDANGLPMLELCDSGAALVHLAKIMGMFVDKLTISGPNDGPIQVDAVRESIGLLLTNQETVTLAMELAEKLTTNDTKKLPQNVPQNITIDAASNPAP